MNYEELGDLLHHLRDIDDKVELRIEVSGDGWRVSVSTPQGEILSFTQRNTGLASCLEEADNQAREWLAEKSQP